jgi:signal transduction histidine kinase
MKPLAVTLIQLSPAARVPAEDAVREVWPHATITTAGSVVEAARLPVLSRHLLVLGEMDEAAVGLAAQTMDAGDLPRWALVSLNREPSDLVETVPPEQWNATLLARVFRAAFLQHELLRENLQLRGDLRTIARRVAHDARTPLGCIQTVCELIKGVPPADRASLLESLDLIGNSTAEINLLVDRVSSLIRASLDPLPPSVFAMGTAVESALRQLPPEAENALARIRQPAQWPEAEGVAAWTESVWWNLIRNALIHGEDGPIQLGWTRENGSIRFWVSSAGAIAPESVQRLLRPFHQLHQNPSAGFGLSVVARLVALQGGQCGYKTSDDNRAVFSFTLRAAPAAAKEPAARSNAGALARER